MELPTYTNIWKIEKRLYKLYDFRLPMPLPVGQIAAFLAIAVPYALILTMVGMPFSHTWIWLYVLPPGLLAWLVTRPVLEAKRLPELVLSQLRYVGEPRTWCRMTPLAEKDEIVVFARVWRSAEYVRPADAPASEAAAPAADAAVASAAPARPAGGVLRPAAAGLPGSGMPVRARGAMPQGQLAPVPVRAASAPFVPVQATPAAPAPARAGPARSAPAGPAPAAVVPVAGAQPAEAQGPGAPRAECGRPTWPITPPGWPPTVQGPAAAAVGPDTTRRPGVAPAPAAAVPPAAAAGAATPAAAVPPGAAAGPKVAETIAAGPDAPAADAAALQPPAAEPLTAEPSAAEPSAAEKAFPRGQEPGPRAEGRSAVVRVSGDAGQSRPLNVVERALRSSPAGRPGGWRDPVVVVSGGHRPGKPDPLQRDQARARLPLAAAARIVVLGCTAGAGQTTTTLMTGQLLASLRGEPVAVLDLSAGSGSLTEQARFIPALLPASRVGADPGGPPPAAGVAAERGLQVVTASDSADDPGRIVNAVVARYPLTLADPDAAAVPKTLGVADQLVLVAPASPEAASALAMTMEWLEAHDHGRLAATAVTVLNGVSGPTAQHVDKAAAVASGRCRAIVRVPWDERLRERPAAALGTATVHAYTALAGVLVAALADSAARSVAQ